MKHINLQILADHGFLVPKFIVVKAGETIDLSFSDAKLFAVRSSFDAEDGADSSFAGQFDTLLNVEREAVPGAVEEVLKSAQKENVSAYLKSRGLTSETSMHVIIQEMVVPAFSGVIFTANPMGILNETVIVVGEGLGSGVVEDRVSTTAYYYNQDDGIFDCHRQDNAPLLEEKLLLELTESARKIQDLFGAEMDIEFAVQDGMISYLRARPITALHTADPIILDNSNIVESYPGLCLPLTQDFVKDVYHGVFYSCVRRISGDQKRADRMDSQLRDMTDVANWRIYYRISNWYAVLKLLPFSGKIIPVWQKMLGVGNRYVSAAPTPEIGFGGKLRVCWRFLSHLCRTPRLMEKLNRRFALEYPKYRRQVEEAGTPEALLAVYHHIRKSILSDWDLTLINDMYTFLSTALAGKGGSQRIADVKNLESMKPALAMDGLVETARVYGFHSRQYCQGAEQYIEAYGDRCLGELKLETRTYRTDPELLDAAVEMRLRSDGMLPITEQKGKWDTLFVRMAKTCIRNREISRLNRSRIFGLSRSIFLKIGRFYADKGQLETARDVFYLRMEELVGDFDRKSLVATRKEEQLSYENTPSYSRLVFAEKIVNRQSAGQQQRVVTGGSSLGGIGTSSGKATGRVLVVTEPDDRLDTAGKILVTRSTDPGCQRFGWRCDSRHPKRPVRQWLHIHRRVDQRRQCDRGGVRCFVHGPVSLCFAQQKTVSIKKLGSAN